MAVKKILGAIYEPRFLNCMYGFRPDRECKPRREGDIATCYCNPQKAAEELGWKAEYGIEEMCADSWKWQSMNPNGYGED